MQPDYTKLDTKEKLLIIKALAEITKDIYNANSDFVLKQVLKAEDNQIRNDYGLFGKRTSKAKTIQEVIDENKTKIEKLQEEINELEKLPNKSAIHKEESTCLTSKYSTLAENIATDILQNIISNMESKKLEKAASKVAKIK